MNIKKMLSARVFGLTQVWVDIGSRAIDALLPIAASILSRLQAISAVSAVDTEIAGDAASMLRRAMLTSSRAAATEIAGDAEVEALLLATATASLELDVILRRYPRFDVPELRTLRSPGTVSGAWYAAATACEDAERYSRRKGAQYP